MTKKQAARKPVAASKRAAVKTERSAAARSGAARKSVQAARSTPEITLKKAPRLAPHRKEEVVPQVAASELAGLRAKLVGEREQVLKLYENARVRSNQIEITGDFISYDMKREVAEVSGAPPGKSPPANAGRVKVIIVPPKKVAGGKKGEEKKPAPPLELKADPGKG